MQIRIQIVRNDTKRMFLPFCGFTRQNIGNFPSQFTMWKTHGFLRRMIYTLWKKMWMFHIYVAFQERSMYIYIYVCMYIYIYAYIYIYNIYRYVLYIYTHPPVRGTAYCMFIPPMGYSLALDALDGS